MKRSFDFARLDVTDHENDFRVLWKGRGLLRDPAQTATGVADLHPVGPRREAVGVDDLLQAGWTDRDGASHVHP